MVSFVLPPPQVIRIGSLRFYGLQEIVDILSHDIGCLFWWWCVSLHIKTLYGHFLQGEKHHFHWRRLILYRKHIKKMLALHNTNKKHTPAVVHLVTNVLPEALSQQLYMKRRKKHLKSVVFEWACVFHCAQHDNLKLFHKLTTMYSNTCSWIIYSYCYNGKINDSSPTVPSSTWTVKKKSWRTSRS